MATCPNCGKELAENEVCSCSTASSASRTDVMGARVKEETTKAVGSMISLVTAVLQSPVDAVTNFVSGEDRKASYQLIGVEMAAVIIADLFYSLMYSIINGSRFRLQSVFQTLIADVVSILAVVIVGSILITFMAKRYGNVTVSFNKALSIASLQAIMISPVYCIYRVLAIFGVSILTYLGSVAYSGAQCLAVMLTYFGFSVVVQDKKKLFYGIGIYFMVLLLVNYIIRRLC